MDINSIEVLLHECDELVDGVNRELAAMRQLEDEQRMLIARVDASAGELRDMILRLRMAAQAGSQE